MREQRRVDLHTHSLFSDGVLLPSEMLRRVEVLGYGALAITDHVDASNLDDILGRMLRFSQRPVRDLDVTFIPGVEITHVRPSEIGPLAHRARLLGARLIVVHGETPVEPVAPGTNRAATECQEVDILAHPGFITAAEAALAAANGVALELTSRGGHSLSNGHVARVALAAGAMLVVNSDTHVPADMLDQAKARLVAMGAGLTEEMTDAVLVTNAWYLVSRATGPVQLSI